MFIKNWMLWLLALILSSMLASLGMWQLSRAYQKKQFLSSFTARTSATPLRSEALMKPDQEEGDKRFYRATLTGHFDYQHVVLLDNKTQGGKIGYEVYTPFITKELPAAILVDRGFIPMGKDRKHLPKIDAVIGQINITGMLNYPPAYLALGKMQDGKKITWPLRVEYINLLKLGKILPFSLYPYILQIEPKHLAALEIEWKIVMSPPERHIGYAIQWFALALTLLISSVVVSRIRK